MFYCLFVLIYRNINLADNLSVVFLMFVLLTTVKLSKKKKLLGLPPFPLLLKLQRV